MSGSLERYGETRGGERRDAAQSEPHNDAGALVSGLPHWENRELTGEFTGLQEKRPGMDVPFLMLTLLILLIGVIMVLSASFARGYYTNGEPMRVFMRQLVFAVSGVAIMLVVSRIGVKAMSRWSYALLAFSVFMLVAVLFVGIEVNEATRWLGFEGGGGSFSFQPSEVAKLALIMSFSQWICANSRTKMRTFKYGIVPFVAVTAVIVGLLMLEPHISASIIIVALTAIMIFAGGARLRWFLLAFLAVALVLGAIMLPMLKESADEDSDVGLTEQIAQMNLAGGRFSYADKRIDAWLNPEADPMHSGYQILQSLYAVGSGGLLGQGLGQSRQKYLYLPEEHNDYIFAIVCEELGFIGAMLILLLFLLLIVRGYWLALHAKDRYSALVATGITSLLAIQVFLNVAVVTNLLPATGISLPFFSYGGTALWIQLFQMGIVLAVSREIPREARAQGSGVRGQGTGTAGEARAQGSGLRGQGSGDGRGEGYEV